MRTRTVTIALAVAGGIGLLAACDGNGDGDTTTTAPAATTAVAIEQFAFSPARIEVKAGTSVRWTNGDAFRHTVTSGNTSGAENVPDGRFDEDLPDNGSTVTVAFDEPGTFTYYCRQHNAMDGTVVVT